MFGSIFSKILGSEMVQDKIDEFAEEHGIPDELVDGAEEYAGIEEGPTEDEMADYGSDYEEYGQ